MTGIRIEALIVHYQPIVDLDSGAVVGFEALSRELAADGSVRSLFLKGERSNKNIGISNAKKGRQRKFNDIKTKKEAHGYQTKQYAQLQKWMWSVMAG